MNGTSANTVFWYTGENGSTPARQTATAQVGPSMTINYGMRANEQAISTLVANVAVLGGDDLFGERSERGSELSGAEPGRRGAILDGQPGTQQISDIEADLANAQTTVSNAGTLNTQTQTTLQDMLQNIDGVNQDSDQRADPDDTEQPVGVVVGDGAVGAAESGQFSGAVVGISRKRISRKLTAHYEAPSRGSLGFRRSARISNRRRRSRCGRNYR